MSKNFEAGIRGLTTEDFARARAGQPAPVIPTTSWTLRTDGVGPDVTAFTNPVARYQGYGEAPALKR